MEKLRREPEQRPELEAIQAQLGELPVLPSLVMRLVTLDMDSEQAFDEVVSIAEQDPTFASRVLALANSASMAPSVEIHSIAQAVSRIGAWKIAELVASMALMDVFVPRGEAGKALWIHSLETAVAARTLARLQQADGTRGTVNPQEAYLLGLLHDIGRLTMLQLGDAAACELAMTIDEGAANGTLLVANERGLLGYDHAELGGLAAERVGLPARLCELIRRHHDAGEETAEANLGEAAGLLRLVQMADAYSVRTTLDPVAFGSGGAGAVEAVEGCLPMAWERPPVAPEAFVGSIPAIAEETLAVIRGMGL